MKPCEGHGQGLCHNCKKKGEAVSTWMCFLYTIDNDNEHIYCYDCAKKLEKQEEDT